MKLIQHRLLILALPGLEVLPAYWGIETLEGARDHHEVLGLEVLPAYWGIETRSSFPLCANVAGLEVLPAYWGIETRASGAGMQSRRAV